MAGIDFGVGRAGRGRLGEEDGLVEVLEVEVEEDWSVGVGFVETEADAVVEGIVSVVVGAFVAV